MVEEGWHEDPVTVEIARRYPNAWLDVHGQGVTVLGEMIRGAGSERLLFGTDSSFFPRGWQRPIYEQQLAIATELDLDADATAKIFGGNMARIFDT